MLDSERCHLRLMRQLRKRLTSLAHARSTSYDCPMVMMYPVRRGLLTSQFFFSEDSANLCLLQQCANDINDLADVTGSVPQDGSALNQR